MPAGFAITAALLLAPFALSPLPAADPAPFDLPGPALGISVTRNGVTLPIGEVPALAEGDKLTIAADLPEDQRARFLLLSAFLSGATNPPPKDWIRTAETWKRKAKDKRLALTVPEGARQLVLFLVPETGGASDTITDAVRGRPGEFVRATQDLNQASLDRSRLNVFMAAIRAQEDTHPEYLRSIAPRLARSLSMKLNADCLAQVIEQQAACLLENRDSLILADVHTSSLSDTLVGAPTDLALQLSYTREGGLGYYSPYIGVVRDIARVFGAFSNPQFGYLPTLSLRQGDRVSLLLNAAPSFAKPKSVMVVSMPAIGPDRPPQLHNAAERPICATRPNAVLPVEGAPLIYSTGYARNMKVRFAAASGRTLDVPVKARPDLGGYVWAGAIPAGAPKGAATAQLHGFWGFDPFDGPQFDLQFPSDTGWSADESAPLAVGRDNKVMLSGPAPACVESISLRSGNAPSWPIAWTMADDGRIAMTLPLRETPGGEVAIEIRQFGAAKPAKLPLSVQAEAAPVEPVAVPIPPAR